MQPRILEYRRVIIALSQAFLLLVAYFLSFFLRFDLSLPEPYLTVFFRTLPLVLIIKLSVFACFGLFRGWWRYVGMSDLRDIIFASALSAPLLYVAVRFTHGLINYPRSVFVIDPVLTILIVAGLRFAVRAYMESARLHLTHANTLIIGAGQAGRMIARELRDNPKLEHNLVGFVDDDRSKRGVKIEGIRVLGGVDDLPSIIARKDAARVLIAIPSASGKQLQRIVDKCLECKVDFKTLPALGDIIRGSVSLHRMRSVLVEDLLFRQPVRLELGRIRAKFEGKVTLITGAGGSIGSELARQVARFNPSGLVLFDQSENDLHEIDLELRQNFPDLRHVAVVGDIRDKNRICDVMAEFAPRSVFHAAAYKHVPMMEKNCLQAVVNNVFGTYNVASAAKELGIEDFVLISTDKAVNPSSVMGVTKRVAERVVLGFHDQPTRFVAVRFGNVLGSKGSVLPLFQRQIAQGKPVTITHKDAKRYFMTIPEAVQLVLQASTMGKGGEIFVLDMGEPVLVEDLARKLIRLSGLEPGKDIPIVYTSLRPGEKLFEELRLDHEDTKPTTHEKIWVLDGGATDAGNVETWLRDLSALVEKRDLAAVMGKIREIVPEYTPSREVLTEAKRP